MKCLEGGKREWCCSSQCWEEVLELRTAQDWRGCAMGEGAEPQELLHLVILAKFCSPGLLFYGKFGDFLPFSRGVLRNFSCHLRVRCRECIPMRLGSVFFWDQSIQCCSKNLPCRVMTRSELFLKLLLLSCTVCPFGNEEQRQSNPPKGRTKGSAAPSPSFPRIKHCSGP